MIAATAIMACAHFILLKISPKKVNKLDKLLCTILNERIDSGCYGHLDQ